MILEVKDVHVYRDESYILKGVTLEIPSGVVALLGRNGMGKSTLMEAIMGLLPVAKGEILLSGQKIANNRPFETAQLGVGYVPQGRRVFASLSVDEHLNMPWRKNAGDWSPARVYDLFPRLHERRKQSGTRLSGGEQQMLAIGRALVTNPRLLIMDEPSEGLAPLIVDLVGATCLKLAETGMAILLVEQNLHLAQMTADTFYVMGTGEIAHQGAFSSPSYDSELLRGYMGIGAAH
jgi:branched-chain amino acid transport system ATP-binding protein